jgi:predicted dehydrogenase
MQTPEAPLQEPNKIRVGIVGVGNIGSAHAATLYGGKVEGAVLTAVCDISPEVRRRCAESYPGVAVYEDADGLFDSEVELVILSVPHPLHGQLAIRAFQKGKHVLTEKPMDISLSRGRQMAEAARKSGKLFGIMFNQRTGNLFQKARQIVHSGALGQLKRSVWIITNWYRSQAYYDSGSWRATWKGEGGGVLMNQCPHQLDLWQWICGMPVKVTAFCEEGKYHNIEVEDEATLFVQFENGATGTFITTTGEYPGTNRLEISGTLGKLVLENGSLKWWKLASDERTYCFAAEENTPKPLITCEEFLQEKINGHRAILQNVTNALRFGEELIAPGYDGLGQLMLQNAAYLSAWKGCTVELPFDEAEYDALLAARQERAAGKRSDGIPFESEDYHPRWQISW